MRRYLHDEPIAARSGHFIQVLSRVFRETHHATILENWGLLWMWHSLALLLALSTLFLVCSLGLGLLVSTLARSQLQAMQIAFLAVDIGIVSHSRPDLHATVADEKIDRRFRFEVAHAVADESRFCFRSRADVTDDELLPAWLRQR